MPSLAPTGLKDANKNPLNDVSKGEQQSLEKMMAYKAKESINQMQATTSCPPAGHEVQSYLPAAKAKREARFRARGRH